MLPQNTRRAVATVNAKLMKPMMLLATEMGGSVEDLEMFTPILIIVDRLAV